MSTGLAGLAGIAGAGLACVLTRTGVAGLAGVNTRELLTLSVAGRERTCFL